MRSGSATIRGVPSTTRVSLENAFMLSFDLALARLASRLGACLEPTWARTRATSDSASKWAYQTQSSVCPASSRRVSGYWRAVASTAVQSVGCSVHL